MKIGRSHKEILRALADEPGLSRDTIMSRVGVFVSARKMQGLEKAGFIARANAGDDAVKGPTPWQLTSKGWDLVPVRSDPSTTSAASTP